MHKVKIVLSNASNLEERLKEALREIDDRPKSKVLAINQIVGPIIPGGSIITTTIIYQSRDRYSIR